MLRFYRRNLESNPCLSYNRSRRFSMRLHRRYTLLAIALVIALDISFLIARQRNLWSWNKSSPSTSTTVARPPVHTQSLEGQDSENIGEAKKELLSVIRKLSSLRPKVGRLERYGRNILDDNTKLLKGELPASSEQLGKYLQVSDKEVEELKVVHHEVVEAIPKRLPNRAFSGRGIVLTGGGKYFPMLLVAIRWIREIDQRTPIEVFMGDMSEYEPVYCNDLFRTLNTKCVVLENIMGSQLYKEVLSKYAFKPLAILMSSFDEVYFMDADSYPIHEPVSVFESKPFEETGMVLNSDYWGRYVSPRFYEIAGVELGGSPSDVQSERSGAVTGASTESGQLVISKSRHFRSLLLTCYYNLLGLEIFFPLIMQGGPGEGDKDTYSMAATMLGEKFYQTKRMPVTLGYIDSHGNFQGKAMVQPDPLSDYEIYVEGKPRESYEKFLNLHANYLKMNPKYLLESSGTERGIPTLQNIRYFGDRANIIKETLEDVDIEARLFSVTKTVTCEWALRQNRIPKDWQDQDVEYLCSAISSHVNWLENNWA